MKKKLKGTLLVWSVMLGAFVTVMTAPAAGAATTCDDYSAEVFQVPLTLVDPNAQNIVVATNTDPKQNEDGYVVLLSRDGDPLTWVTVNTTNPGVSGHVHENGEVVDWQLPPGSRPVHFVNCKYVAPRGL